MRILLLFATFSLLNLSCAGPSDATQGYFPKKFTVELPKGWSSKPRLIKAMTELLPEVFKELKDLEYCRDCKAGYTIKLEITDPKIGLSALSVNGTEVKMYNFTSKFILFNNKNEGLVYLDLVTTEDAFMLNPPASPVGGATFANPLNAYSMPGQNTIQVDPRTYTETGQNRRASRSARYGRGNKIDRKDLLIHTEQRILELHKLVMENDGPIVEN